MLEISKSVLVKIFFLPSIVTDTPFRTQHVVLINIVLETRTVVVRPLVIVFFFKLKKYSLHTSSISS